jgi:DNA-binding NtrC family response regulator
MNAKKYKVLIVDDEPALRSMLSTLLSSAGHLCFTASDGIEALKKTEREYFDAVITDVVMPHMDGITLTKKLLKQNPSLAVAVMTGFSDKYSAEDVRAAGASDFIDKTFAVDQFCVRFSEMMRDHETRNQAKISDYKSKP